MNLLELMPISNWIVLALGTSGLVLLHAVWSGWQLRRRVQRLGSRLAEASSQRGLTDVLLAETTAELSLLKQRAEQLTTRQDATAATAVRSGFRQAIALSRHGATTRQLIDTCGLSQGEAHLIQTLYGRPEGASGPLSAEEMH